MRLPGARRGSLPSRDGFLLSTCLVGPCPQPQAAGFNCPVSEGPPSLPSRCSSPFLQRLSPNTHLLVDSEVSGSPAWVPILHTTTHKPGGGAGLGVRLSWGPHPPTLRPSLEGQPLHSSPRKPGRLGLLSWVFRRTRRERERAQVSPGGPGPCPKATHEGQRPFLLCPPPQNLYSELIPPSFL